MIFYEPLNSQHIPLMHRWFNSPHVQQFYSLRDWTENEVRTKLLSTIERKQSLQGYIAAFKERPIGYIQCYPLQDYPWEGLAIPNEISLHAAGLDLFIGEPDYVGKGLGRAILSQFLKEHIWPFYDYCFADPAEANSASVKLFEKVGFSLYARVNSKDALTRYVKLMIMMKKRTV